MNKKQKKILNAGLALNMTLINIPYNVFANSEIVEDAVLNSEGVISIDNESLNDLIKEEQYLEDEQSTMEGGNLEDINNEIDSNLSESIKEDDSFNISNNINSDLLSGTDNSVNYKNISKQVTSITNYADSFTGGDGTQENPYQISTALELARLAYLVKEEQLDTTNTYFKLTSDIDLKEFDSDSSESNGNWTPIGYTGNESESYIKIPFKGSFDGGGYTISNVNIISDENTTNTSSGFFACVEDAEIKNLNIKNISINSKCYNNGALIAYAEGEILLDNINIENIDFVESDNSTFKFGSLIGYLYGNTIVSNINIDFTNKLNLKFKDKASHIGGLVGALYTYTTGAKNTFENIKVKGAMDCAGYLGFIVAEYGSSNNEISLKNVDANIDVSIVNKGVHIGTIAYVNGQSSVNFDDINVNLNTSALNEGGQIDAFSVGGLIGYESNASEINVNNININIDNLIDAISHYGGLFGFYTMSSTLEINNIDVKIKDIQNIDEANKSNTSFFWGGISGMSSYSLINGNIENFNFEVINKFNLVNSKTSVYFGGVCGFNQGNYNLKNSKISFGIDLLDAPSGYVGGLIGYNSGKKINIENVSVLSDVKQHVEKNSIVGGLMGLYVGDDFSIKNSYHKGDISGDYSGGLVGSYFEGKSLNIDNFYSISNVSGTKSVGGFFGIRSYDNATVKITDLNLNNIYLVGSITSENSETDLICSDYEGTNITATNIYYNQDLYEVQEKELEEDEPITVVLDTIGLTTKQMQGLNARENMDFDYNTLWKVNRDYYPTFEQINTAPELSGNDIELILNQGYNLLDYVTVEDFEDKGLIPTVVTDLDITKVGNYTATFTVTDPKGLSDTLTLNIKVVMESPVITAENITLYVGDTFKAKDYATAIDIDGKDITQHIKVIQDTVNTSQKGVYKVVYQVDSLAKLTTTKEITVTVLEKPSDNNNNNNGGNNNTNNTDKDNTDKDKVENDKDADKDKDKTETDKDKTETSTSEKPKTGDNIALFGITTAISLCGLFFINKKNKKNQDKEQE